MEFVIKGTAKELADLVQQLQGRQKDGETTISIRNATVSPQCLPKILQQHLQERDTFHQR